MATDSQKGIYFIQFPHPQTETTPKRGGSTVEWNCNAPQRKFLVANGDYMDKKDIVKNQPLTFWGEWSPMSKVVRKFPSPKPYPKYLQEPQLIMSDPACQCSSRQNTDPFVFSDGFRYCGCKQRQRRKTGEVLNLMALLEPGSIILFGSNFNTGKADAYFGVDTVFVVGSYREIGSFSGKDIVGIAQDSFFPPHFDIIMNPQLRSVSSNQKIEPNCWGPRFYIGATPDNPIEGMYSFVPCKNYDEKTKQGFERPRITQEDIANLAKISNGVRNFQHTQTDLETNKKIWDNIRKHFAKQGFLEGVRFDYTLLP